MFLLDLDFFIKIILYLVILNFKKFSSTLKGLVIFLLRYFFCKS